MNKRALHHLLRSLRFLSHKLLAIVFGVLLVSSIFLVRNNNVTMVNLRQAVFEADKNNAGIEQAIDKLRSYVYTHMNTDLSGGNSAIKLPLQLTYSYQRAVTAEKERVVKANAAVSTDAQKYCEEHFPQSFYGSGRVPCIEKYTADHGVKEQPVPSEYFTYNFASPAWSFDAAGWFCIFTVLTGLIWVLKSLLDALAKRRFRQ